MEEKASFHWKNSKSGYSLGFMPKGHGVSVNKEVVGIKIIKRILLGLHLFVGLGAMAGGLAAITDPETPMGITVEALKNSPFRNFLIPGIVLFTVIGLGNLFSAAMYLAKTKYQGYISSVFSWALVIWIVIQCIMLWAVAFLHVLFFGIGLAQAALSAMLLFEHRLFPTNIILYLYHKLLKKD